MNCRHNFISSIIFILLCLTLAACGSTKVRQTVLMPANSDEMKNVKKLAVVGFTGDKKKEFSSRMEVFFSNIKVKNKPYFTVVDQATLARTLQEKNKTAANTQTATPSTTNSEASNSGNEGLILSVKDPIDILGSLLSSERNSKESKSTSTKTSATTSGTSGFSREDAISIAKLSGADTIITGNITGPSVRQSSYKEDRQDKDVCLKKSGDKCKQYGTKKINCVKQTGDVKFVMKAVDVNNGKITFSKSYTGTSENKYCEDSEYNKKTIEALSNTAVEKAIAKTRNDVAPYRTVVTIELMEKDDSRLADNKEANTLFEKGLKLADNKHIYEACTNFKLAADGFDQSPALMYNLGVCEEIKNNLDEASSLYSRASNLSQKPLKLISTAQSRVDSRRAKNQRVENQLR